MTAPQEALDVVAFWRDAGPKKWFAKDSAFDIAFRDRFALLYSRASRGELKAWRTTPEGALAEILLLDQFPRNVFRGTLWSFATDAAARAASAALIAAGHDQKLPVDMRAFAYMPYVHSEALPDQDRALSLMETLGGDYAHHAEEHRKVIQRFGRFPHRNETLGRTSTPEETAFLQGGGYTP